MCNRNQKYIQNKSVSWTVYVRNLHKVFFSGEKKPMTYDVIRTIIKAYTLQNIYIYF